LVFVHSIVRLVAAAAVPAAIWCSAALAQSDDLARAFGKHITLQGITSATVPPAGIGYVSISGTTRRGGVGRNPDGSAEIGLGFGSAENGVGVQLGAVITSLTRAPGDSGYLTLKLSRRLAAGRSLTYAALSVERLANWGDARGVNPSATASLTNFSALRLGRGGEVYPVMITIGAGTDIRARATRPGAFAGIGIGLSEAVAVSAAWTGETADLGVSLRPGGGNGMLLTLEANDITDRLNSRRLTLSAIWTFRAFGGVQR
jgi:hypothetical protein